MTYQHHFSQRLFTLFYKRFSCLCILNINLINLRNHIVYLLFRQLIWYNDSVYYASYSKLYKQKGKKLIVKGKKKHSPSPHITANFPSTHSLSKRIWYILNRKGVFETTPSYMPISPPFTSENTQWRTFSLVVHPSFLHFANCNRYPGSDKPGGDDLITFSNAPPLLLWYLRIIRNAYTRNVAKLSY